jgi:hypothetical protein
MSAEFVLPASRFVFDSLHDALAASSFRSSLYLPPPHRDLAISRWRRIRSGAGSLFRFHLFRFLGPHRQICSLRCSTCSHHTQNVPFTSATTFDSYIEILQESQHPHTKSSELSQRHLQKFRRTQVRHESFAEAIAPMQVSPAIGNMQVPRSQRHPLNLYARATFRGRKGRGWLSSVLMR